MTEATLGNVKQMRLRFAGQCTDCRSDVAAGELANYHRDSKTVTCISCTPQLAPVQGPTEPTAVVDAVEVVTGNAGASALREYERRKGKRETRIREAHPVMGGLLLALSDDPQSIKAWAVGARGEELLGTRLDRLAGKNVYALHDRRIPKSKANIDHIAVSAAGVFVIDAKKYTGRPALRVEGGLFRPRTETLVVGTRDCSKLVAGAQKQVDLVTAALALVGFGDVPVRGMLCFVEGDWPLFGGDFTIAGIDVLWPRKASEHILKAGSIGDARVQDIHRVLAVAFPLA